MRKRDKTASAPSVEVDNYGYFPREVQLKRMAEFRKRWNAIWEEISASGGKNKDRDPRTRRAKRHRSKTR